MYPSSTADAGLLLRKFKWNENTVIEKWFEDEAKVRSEVGLILRETVDNGIGSDDEFECLIGGMCFATSHFFSNECLVAADCLDECKGRDTFSLACGHRFCNGCWKYFVSSEIASGANAVYARCMMPRCPEVVPEDVFRRFCSPGDLEKYLRWTLYSFVDANSVTPFPLTTLSHPVCC
jgi:ariadne-1